MRGEETEKYNTFRIGGKITNKQNLQTVNEKENEDKRQMERQRKGQGSEGGKRRCRPLSCSSRVLLRPSKEKGNISQDTITVCNSFYAARSNLYQRHSISSTRISGQEQNSGKHVIVYLHTFIPRGPIRGLVTSAQVPSIQSEHVSNNLRRSEDGMASGNINGEKNTNLFFP